MTKIRRVIYITDEEIEWLAAEHRKRLAGAVATIENADITTPERAMAGVELQHRERRIATLTREHTRRERQAS